jgi:hypothetical protein
MEASKTAERPPKFRRAVPRHDQKLTSAVSSPCRIPRSAAFRLQQLRRTEGPPCLAQLFPVDKFLQHKRRAPLLLGVSPWRIFGAFLALIFLFISASTLWSSDFYLSHVGPSPIRFAALPAKPGDFVWPISLIPARAATNVVADTSSASSTNAAISLPGASEGQSQTNSVSSTPVSETAASATLIGPSMPNGLDGNPLSASNLLVVTPQMLADYFKANLDTSMRQSTNAPAGADVQFNPPIPKPAPSSEAIYRTQ